MSHQVKCSGVNRHGGESAKFREGQNEEVQRLPTFARLLFVNRTQAAPPDFPQTEHIRAKAIVGEARVDGDQMLVKIPVTLGDL